MLKSSAEHAVVMSVWESCCPDVNSPKLGSVRKEMWHGTWRESLSHIEGTGLHVDVLAAIVVLGTRYS